MPAKNFNSQSVIYEQLLFDSAEELCLAAAKTVRAARGEVRKSANIIAHSRTALERAHKVLDKSSRRHSEMNKKARSGGRSKR